MEYTGARSDALARELRNVVHQAEELLQAVRGERDAAVGELRDKVHTALDHAKSRLAEMEGETYRASQRAAVTAGTYIRENPWTTVALGAGIGLLVGAVLLGNRYRLR